MVALVRCARRPLRTAVEGDHNIGSQGGDRLGDLGTQLGCVADLAVREIPELHVVDADDGGRPALFALPAAAPPPRAACPRCRPHPGKPTRSARSCPATSTWRPPPRSRTRGRRDAAPAPARYASRSGTASSTVSMQPHRGPRWRSSARPSPRRAVRRAAAAPAAASRRRSPRRAGRGRRRRAPRRAATASASRVRTATNTSVKRLITRALRSASAAMSAISPGSAARTSGLVNTSRAAAIIAWTSARDIARRRLDRRRRGGEGRLVDQLGLARPPPVQRRLGGARPLGDRGHGQVRIPDFHKQIRGRAQYGSVDTRIPGPPGARGLVNRGRVCFHNATHRIVITGRRKNLWPPNRLSKTSADSSIRVETSARCPT